MRGVVTAFVLNAWLAVSAACVQADDGGKALYQRCAVCHQTGGAGIPGIFPPLKNRLARIVASSAGRDYVTMVLTEGLTATIEIEGVSYVGAMPAQHLTDAEVANVVRYIATDFGRGDTGAKPALSAAEVKAIRARFSGGKAVPAAVLRARVPQLDGH